MTKLENCSTIGGAPIIEVKTVWDGFHNPRQLNWWKTACQRCNSYKPLVAENTQYEARPDGQHVITTQICQDCVDELVLVINGIGENINVK